MTSDTADPRTSDTADPRPVRGSSPVPFGPALSSAAQWPVDRAAAVVVNPQGPIDWIGEPDWVTRIASIAKLLVGYACLVALEEGTVRLEDACGPPGSTLRHCLAHASGLAFNRATAGRAERVRAVGTRRIYSNLGIEAAAEHLATSAGMEFEEYLQAGVLAPLAMTATELRGSPAYAVWSSAADLARLAQELLAPTLISQATLALARTPQFPGLPGIVPGLPGWLRPCPWGLGFELKLNKARHWTGTLNSAATFGHFGGAGTFLWVDPEPQIALVALTDREFGDWALDVWPRFSDAVLCADREFRRIS